MLVRNNNNYELIKGDAFESIKNLPPKSVDLILTDPPYNIAKYVNPIYFKKDKVDDTEKLFAVDNSQQDEKVIYSKSGVLKSCEWDHDVFDPIPYIPEFKRVVKDKGNVVIFTSSPLFGIIRTELENLFSKTNFAVWYKSNPVPSFRKSSFLNSIELIIMAWCDKHTFNFTNQNEMHNVFKFPILGGNERLKGKEYHPAQKPVALLKHLIKIMSNEGDVVLDPFMGTGSTGVAAIECNRKFIGSEREDAHFESAERRLKCAAPFDDHSCLFK